MASEKVEKMMAADPMCRRSIQDTVKLRVRQSRNLQLDLFSPKSSGNMSLNKVTISHERDVHPSILVENETCRDVVAMRLMTLEFKRCV